MLRRLLHYVFGVPLVWVKWGYKDKRDLRILRSRNGEFGVYWPSFDTFEWLSEIKGRYEIYGSPHCTCCKKHTDLERTTKQS